MADIKVLFVADDRDGIFNVRCIDKDTKEMFWAKVPTSAVKGSPKSRKELNQYLQTYCNKNDSESFRLGFYFPDTEKVLEQDARIHDDLVRLYKFTDVDPSNFNAPDIDVKYVIMCLDPESNCYGTAKGVFVYKDGRVFQFDYNIHRPKCKGPHKSNTMSNIQQIVTETAYGIITAKYIDTDFGRDAFLYYTPTDTLDDEAKSFRLLTQSIQAYCRKENLCERLRDTDDIHEKWNITRMAKWVNENSVYGVLQ